MHRKILKIIFTLLLLSFSINASAFDFSKLPESVQKSLHKYYKDQKIKVLSVKTEKDKYIIIIQQDEGKDKVIVTKDGKLLSVSDYYIGVQFIDKGC